MADGSPFKRTAAILSHPMKLLFICTHNRCRSILAEAITNHIAGGKISAVSAGSSPQGEVHPLSLKYLAEHQISIEGLRSKSWDEFENYDPDAIITLCDSAADESCPIWFGQSLQVHWGLSDPSKASVDEAEQRTFFNSTIELLSRRTRALLESGSPALRGEPLRVSLRQIADQIH